MSILEVLKLTLPEQRYRPLEPGEKITEDEAQARVEYALSECMGSVIRLDPQNYGEIDPKQKAEIEEGLSELHRIYASLAGKLPSEAPKS